MRAMLRNSVSSTVYVCRYRSGKDHSVQGRRCLSKITHDHSLTHRSADAVFGFKAGETMQTSRPTSASGEDDDEDTGSEEYSDDRASD